MRTLLVLGRVSNLPTVWSNCLAGWWLGGGGNFKKLPLLLLGVSALYIGGMYLNDAFDEDFDRQRRPERPIPSGKISARQVWRWGWAWLALGIVLLLIFGQTTGALALLLALFILIYNAMHKFITASPWLMGACRFWVYVIAGVTGAAGLNGWADFLRRGAGVLRRRLELRRAAGKFARANSVLAAAAAGRAALARAADEPGRFPPRAALWFRSSLFSGSAYCIRTIFLGRRSNVGRIVSGLLAGIVFVDWLAVAPESPRWLSLFSSRCSG